MKTRKKAIEFLIYALIRKFYFILWKLPFREFLLTTLNIHLIIKHCNWTEAVTWRCSVKNVFLKVSQNSQENTFARVSQ